MAFALPPEAVSAGYRLAAYPTIGSTSAEAADRARAGDPGRVWVVSRAQTAGYGRRGRAWATPEGNLAASLLLKFPAPVADPAQLGFAAGLALAGAIAEAAPEVEARVAFDGADSGLAGSSPASLQGIRLKWPNDVLLGGGKIAGILLQAVTSSSGEAAVVIGIGVNVADAPHDTPYPATSLAACGSACSAETVFAALAKHWIAQEGLLDEGRGFPAIRDQWLERAAGLGAPIAVNTGAGGILRGTFDTIDASGMLVVRDGAGTFRRIAAGDVHFGDVATARG